MGVLIRCRVELGGGEGRGMRRGWNGSNSRTRVGHKSKFPPKGSYVDTENTFFIGYMCGRKTYAHQKDMSHVLCIEKTCHMMKACLCVL
jgi:hypothetical protein